MAIYKSPLQLGEKIINKPKRNKKIPDWDLYDSDEEAMANAEEMMLENVDITPWADDWTLGQVVQNMSERHPYMKPERIRSLITEDGYEGFEAKDDNEPFNAFRQRKWDYFDNH